MSLRTTLALLALAPAALLAQPKPHTIDASHSEINFVAESRLLSAHGFFGKWSAEINYDQADPNTSSVSITIDPASINTRNDRRDGHLKSPDFFDVAKYPEIKFVSKKVVKIGAKGLNIVGDLTMHGVTKEVTAPATMVFYDGGAGRFKGSFSINRKDFGVGFSPPTNMIDEDVQIGFEMVIREKKAP